MLAATGTREVAPVDAARLDGAAVEGAAVEGAAVDGAEVDRADVLATPYEVLPFADVPWEAILPSWKAAYPPGHPDHETGDDQTLIDVHLRPYVEQGALGPAHRSSGVALRSGQVAAGIIISLRPEPAPFGGPWVTEVWRDPAPKYRGVGSLLIRRAMHLLNEDGYVTLGLAVSHSNPARMVYEALGFEQTSESWTLRLP
jgi:ribosomal protein S18 acetylase RimI-like enzyme